MGILIFKGFFARRLYKSFGVKGLIATVRSFPGAKRSGRYANYEPPFSAMVMSVEPYLCSATRLHVAHRDKFFFTSILVIFYGLENSVLYSVLQRRRLR
jgi:hypothetical protein